MQMEQLCAVQFVNFVTHMLTTPKLVDSVYFYPISMCNTVILTHIIKKETRYAWLFVASGPISYDVRRNRPGFKLPK